MSNEIIRISPEGLRVAEAYIANGHDLAKTAEFLDMDKAQVQSLLNKRETKNYIDQLFMESGFRNRAKMADLMDEIISAKLEELADTGMGSSKDILEILLASHKMQMDQMTLQLKILEIENKAPSIQINQQVNHNGGTHYNSLLEKLLKR